mgnify:CR=1 FL=1
MPRFKNRNGIVIQLTAEEETARDVEEQAYADDAFNRDIRNLRRERNAFLIETDFYALSDVTMSEDMTTYRQALRDLPAGLSTVDDVATVTWPTKP